LTQIINCHVCQLVGLSLFTGEGGFDLDEEAAGIAIRAMQEPLRQIVTNAGAESSVVLNNVREGKGNYGYNASIGEYVDMIETGILDPTKVVRSALQNASSVAGLPTLQLGHHRNHGGRTSEGRAADA